MFLEIQRIAITCLLLLNYAYSQDAQNVKANVEVLGKSRDDPFAKPGIDPFATPDVDPFAKPDVDPFASMTSDSNAKSTNKATTTKVQTTVTKTVVQPTGTTVIKTTRNTPVVAATQVTTSTRTVNSGVADSKTLESRNENSETQVQQGTNTRSSSSTGSTNVQNTGLPSRTADSKVSTSITKSASVTNSGRGITMTSSDTQPVTKESSILTTRQVVQNTNNILRGPTVSTRTTTSGTEVIPLTVTRTKIVKSSDSSSVGENSATSSRTVTNTRDLNEANSGINKEISSGSVVNTDANVRRINPGSLNEGSLGINRAKSSSSVDVNTRGSNVNEENSDFNRQMSSNFVRNVDTNIGGMDNVATPPLISPGSNSARIFNEQTVTEEPILFIRVPFRDQRICETCIGDGSDCYLEHPDDCRKYIRCSASSAGAAMEALEMNCAFGTFWSNEANTCDLASDVYCQKDPCMDTRLKAYPSGINCRSYWRCSNGRSHGECCPNGEAFVDGVCASNDSCKVDNDECPYKFRKEVSEKDIIEIKPECHLESVPGNIFAFKMKSFWGAPFQCSDGTRFDQNKCTCVPHVFTARLCKPIADLNFTSYEVFNNVRNYIQVNNVTNSQGYGLYNGRAFVAVPYFKNNENIGSHFVIRMRFYHDGKQGFDSQVLASNCKTKTGRELSPSFAILLSKSKKQIIFFASTKQENKPRYGATTSISLPFQPSKWTIVELRFLGEVLFAKVETLEADGTSEVVTDEKVLKGTLSTSVMPLMVGNCNMNDGFVGYIDQVKTYVCDPGHS